MFGDSESSKAPPKLGMVSRLTLVGGGVNSEELEEGGANAGRGLVLVLWIAEGGVRSMAPPVV